MLNLHTIFCFLSLDNGCPFSWGQIFLLFISSRDNFLLPFFLLIIFFCGFTYLTILFNFFFFTNSVHFIKFLQTIFPLFTVNTMFLIQSLPSSGSNLLDLSIFKISLSVLHKYTNWNE